MGEAAADRARLPGGVWHGFIFPVARIVPLLRRPMSRSTPCPNNGGWYDFGYFSASAVAGVGAAQVPTVYRTNLVRDPRSHEPMPLLEARKTSTSRSNTPGRTNIWKRQQQIHWMPEEVPLGEDCRDWAQKLTDHERNLLTQIFRFFTQADVEVQDCYHEKYGRVFKPTEIKMMLAAFSNMETVHIAAYSHLLDTIGMPESEYGMFLQYKEMKDKHDYLATFGVDTRRGHRQDAGHVRRLHRGAAAVRQLRHADELPALQQDEGHGPDRQLVGARREPPLRRHHQACSTPSSRSATA